MRCIRGKLGVDKVFFIRFAAIASAHKVLNGGPIFFDSKPNVMKSWDENMTMNKDLIKTIFIWVKLVGLDVKYGGEASVRSVVNWEHSLKLIRLQE